MPYCVNQIVTIFLNESKQNSRHCDNLFITNAQESNQHELIQITGK